MRKHFEPKGVKVFAPSYDDHDAQKSHTHLLSFVQNVMKDHPHTLLVGCSLGGFWSHYISNELRLPSLLLNPAMKPWETLDKYVGVDHAGKAGFTKANVKAFHDFNFKNARPSVVHEPRTVLLEKGDTVLDPHQIQKDFTGHAEVKLLEGGSHRFDDFDQMNKSIEELGNTITMHGA
jgi:predicted esterase YcpF (UPF0227 family)